MERLGLRGDVLLDVSVLVMGTSLGGECLLIVWLSAQFVGGLLRCERVFCMMEGSL